MYCKMEHIDKIFFINLEKRKDRLGQFLEECKKINQSLSALGNVIIALTDLKNNRQHIPYRDSKITRILEDSLGGNCKTTFIATISPAVIAFGESLNTIRFADRAK